MEQTLGKRIIENRKRLGMTQDKLAERLGVTAQAVSKWENDQSCPDIAMLPRLAEIFGISTDALLGISSSEQAPVHEAEVVSNSRSTHGKEPENHWEMKWDFGRKGSLGFALWILLTGGLLLTANILSWDASLWGIAWPSALLMLGVFGLFPKFSFFSLACTLFGGYFLLNNLNAPLPFIPFDKTLLLPLGILLLGGSLLVDALKKSRRPHFSVSRNGKKVCSQDFHDKGVSDCSMEGERFSCDNSFGEQHHRITLPRVSCGDISNSFGQLTVDLTGCGEIANGCRVDVDNAFGQTEIRIPRTCRAEATKSTAFGNVHMNGKPDEDASAVIYLDCDASFGEIEIRYI